jgi:hypothetical protein
MMYLLDVTRKAQAKNKQMELHQAKHFWMAEEPMNKMKRQPMGWDNTYGKGFIFRMKKEFIQVNCSF